MRILLSGFGAMGKVVAELAHELNHTVVGVFSLLPVENCPYTLYDNPQQLPDADIIIDFSHPNNITPLLTTAANHQLPIVVATTGAKDHLQVLMNEASEHVPVFFSANMSYGVHVFTEILKIITPLLNGYDIEMIERHHNQKIDSPSGTAIKLLEALQSVRPELTPIYDRTLVDHKRSNNEIGMSVVRGGSIVGDHDVIFAGVDELIEIKHHAQSKRIFANGAITAAMKLIDKPAGFYNFNSL